MSRAGYVRNAEGRSIAKALVYFFQTDATGFYTPDRAMDEPNARLFGYMRTADDGEQSSCRLRMLV